MVTLFFALSCGISGILYQFRLLPSLRPDAIQPSGGPWPPERFAHMMSGISFFFAAVYSVITVVSVLTLDGSQRRFLASLPRWQQWLIWPFHGAAVSGTSAYQPPSMPPGP